MFFFSGAVGIYGQLSAADALEKFELGDVEKLARVRAEQPYRPAEPLPGVLAGLSYDQYRAIKIDPSMALWKGEDREFRLEFFHPGYLFTKPVQINLVSSDRLQVQRLAFDSARFDYSDLVVDVDLREITLEGYAGFRIQHPLNTPAAADASEKVFDEIGSFVGSSYFRLLGRDQRYGISARALALNVARSGVAEEFPDFVEYWIVEPEAGQARLELFALLDSPSVAGAFSFTITPGESTVANVEAVLFFRNAVASVGLAPLTSMFWFGENSTGRPFSDWRPEVHDSDGLLLRTWNDELVWRPLVNDRSLRFGHFNAPDVQGFGLLQRDRDFDHYQDLSNPYQRTPSAWIEPQGKWGSGAVRLIELPTDGEGIDNVVSFFEPEQSPLPGQPFRYGYRLEMKMNDECSLSPGRVVATRIGVDVGYADTRRFVLDFDGPALRDLPADAPVWAEITSSANGYVDENQCFKNVHTGGWRVEFKLDTDDDNDQPVELRCTLRSSEPSAHPLSETWSYQWRP